MQLRIFYRFVCTLCAISCFAMDVDQSPTSPTDQPTAEQVPDEQLSKEQKPEEQGLRNPSSPIDSSNKYCLFLKVSGDNIVPIPEGFRDFFGEKIEIAKTLNPDTMTLLLPQLDVETVKFVLELLGVYLLTTWDTVTEKLQITPFDVLIKTARATTLLNLYDLKPIVRDVIINALRAMTPVEKATVLVTFNVLEDYFVQPIKVFLFGDFKKKLRDKNPFFGVQRKQLIQIPDQTTKDFCVTGDGTALFWVTSSNNLKGYRLTNNTQLFDFYTASGQTPVTDFLITDNTLLTTNYTGSLCCLTQQDTKMAIFDTKTNAFRVIRTDDSIIKSIPSNNGSVLFVETKSDATYLSKRDDEDLFSEANLLAIPYEDEEHNYSEVLSACFSRNDTFLYVLYEHRNTKQHALCVYSVANGQPVARLNLSDAWCIAPAQQEDHCWLLCDGKVKKIHCNHQSKKFNTLLEIPVDAKEYYFLQVNSDESYLILNNIELVNVAARKTACRYKDFIVFGSNPKSVIFKESNLQNQGLNNFIQVSLRAPEVNVEIDDLFARLSLVQISTLENLMQIFSVNPQADTQPLIDFIKSVPKNLRDFVQAYCFTGIKLPRLLEQESDRPTKKQKREHQ